MLKGPISYEGETATLSNNKVVVVVQSRDTRSYVGNVGYIAGGGHSDQESLQCSPEGGHDTVSELGVARFPEGDSVVFLGKQTVVIYCLRYVKTTKPAASGFAVFCGDICILGTINNSTDRVGSAVTHNCTGTTEELVVGLGGVTDTLVTNKQNTALGELVGAIYGDSLNVCSNSGDRTKVQKVTLQNGGCGFVSCWSWDDR